MTRCFLSFCLLLSVFTATAAIKLPRIFTDHMVLQRETRVKLWGWADAGSTVRVKCGWNSASSSFKADAAGKWSGYVNTGKAGGPYSLSFSQGNTITLQDILLGEVWICSGQSNMEMPMKGFKGQPITGANSAILHSTDPQLRLFIVQRAGELNPVDTIKTAYWQKADPASVSEFSATGYYFGKDLRELLNVPVGLVQIAWGGSWVEAWMSKDMLKDFPEIQLPVNKDSIKIPNRTPTVLYNAMIHPVVGFTVKGMTWYQGESNYERPDQYGRLFPTMVREWRKEWAQGDFPFYFMQLAPYDYAQLPPYRVGGKFNSAYLRDEQRRSVERIPNSGMVVLMDIGQQATIHPPDKKEGGERLALLALADTYHLKGFAGKSPMPDSIKIKGHVIEVPFRNAENWLTSYGKPLSQFEIAGKDGVYHPAQAIIYRSSVMVSSPEVQEPVAVRYAFKDYIRGELFSTEGLPVPSFRTDNW